MKICGRQFFVGWLVGWFVYFQQIDSVGCCSAQREELSIFQRKARESLSVSGMFRSGLSDFLVGGGADLDRRIFLCLTGGHEPELDTAASLLTELFCEVCHS